VIRVLLADDQALVRTGFRYILQTEPDIEVIGEADDGAQAVDMTPRLRPDVILMDIRMPALNGIEATRRLTVGGGRAPRIVILTTFDPDEYVFQALRAGASGFLLKTAPADQLISAVRLAADGDAMLSPSITRRLIEDYARRPAAAERPAVLAELTPRELDVMRLLARGLSNAEIADELVVAPATVKSHIASLLQKLDLRDRVQLVVMAYESGLVQAGANAI
jgi:DNA-binding NarL/FixJ family response regulator